MRACARNTPTAGHVSRRKRTCRRLRKYALSVQRFALAGKRVSPPDASDAKRNPVTTVPRPFASTVNASCLGVSRSGLEADCSAVEALLRSHFCSRANSANGRAGLSCCPAGAVGLARVQRFRPITSSLSTASSRVEPEQDLALDAYLRRCSRSNSAIELERYVSKAPNERRQNRSIPQYCYLRNSLCFEDRR